MSSPSPPRTISGGLIVAVILAAALVLLLEHTGVLLGLDNHFYDLACKLKGGNVHDDRIIIAAIDEKALSRLGRWPVCRAVYSDLLDAFGQAAAVGLNIILSESSEEDPLLARAIERQGRVVLPVYIESRLHISYPARQFSPARLGHVHLEPDADGCVRTVFRTISCESVSIPSFADAIRDLLDGNAQRPGEMHSKASSQEACRAIRQTDPMRINFRGGPGAFHYISVADVLDGLYPPSFFARKVVLLGKTAAGLDEAIQVPVCLHRIGMPSVEVHAHILSNLLENDPIRQVAPWSRSVFLLAVASLCLFLFVRIDSLGGTVLGGLILLLIAFTSYGLLAGADLWLPPAGPSLAVLIVLLLTYLQRLHGMKRLLLQAKKDWEESFDTINDAITVHDADCSILRANLTAREVFGEPLLVLLGERCKRLRREIQERGRTEERFTRSGGFTEELFDPALDRHLEIKSFLRIDERRNPAGMVQIVRDISERRKAERERRIMESRLIEAQKMEAIGTLAGGIAHDFNNILAAVVGYTELCLQDTPDGGRLRDRLEQLLKASQRAKELVDQILAFSRQAKGESRPRPIRVGLIIKEALKLLRSTIPSTIEIRQDIDTSHSVMIDPGHMHQVVMNLCTNAKHAMETDGGVLTVELKGENITGAGPGDAEAHLLPGPYVRLTVSDTGHGMSPEVMSRIFEPYFTTKKKGVGTGLGLATVRAIVKNHGGAVTVESEVGNGATFHIYLPRTAASEEKSEPGTPVSACTGSERILFVDDEEPLLNVGRDMLRHLGYDVVAWSSSLEALRDFQERPHHFDLVVTDMTMPGMTGEKLALELMRIRPDIPVVLYTGYSGLIDEERAARIGIKAFIMKPLTFTDLARVIREVLDRK